MQHLPNNNLHKFPSEKGKGLAGTLLIHLVVLMFLVFFSFSVPAPPEKQEGILVNFGTDETGEGLIEPSPPAVQEVTPPQAATAVPEKTEDDPVLTQNTEDAPVVKKVDPEAEKKRLEKIEADKIRRAELLAEKIRKQEEETERKRIEAEQRQVADIMNKTRNALANSKNAGTSSTSEGITGGTGNQGVTTGSVDSKVRGDGSGTGNSGISYELEGREFQKLPPPKYDYQGEGIVVVEVTVDRQGNVTKAVPGIKGSTTLDEYLLKVAKDAALEAKFKEKAEAAAVQKGTIKYIFKLK